MEGAIAVFIPIVMFLVIGLICVTFFFFRSKEKQLMIDKGLSYEQMMELLKVKTDHMLTLKFGIIVVFFGLGLGLGFLFQSWTFDHDIADGWMAFWIITMTGLGFIAAYFAARKLKNGNGK